MKNEPNRAPAKEATASGQRPGALAHGTKWGDPSGEHTQSLERPPRSLSSARETILPITDKLWEARNRMAAYKEAATHVGSKNNKRSALALHEASQELMDLRDEFDAAGWDVEARWIHHAGSCLNMAARFCWRLRGGKDSRRLRPSPRPKSAEFVAQRDQNVSDE